MIQCAASMQESQSRTVPAPWRVHESAGLEAMRDRFAIDGWLIAAFNLSRPSADEVLWTNGFEHDTLRQWMRTLPDRDQLFQHAMQVGVAHGPIEQTAWVPPGLARVDGNAPRHVLYAVAPGSFGAGTHWFLAARRHRSFTADEVSTLHRLVHQWSCRFNSPSEPGMVRMLVGSANRLILIDPTGEQMLIDHAIRPSILVERLVAVINQRWPDLMQSEPHDVALEFGERHWWIRFHRHNPIGADGGEHWYIELRPLAKDEMKTVGLVGDDRIARALAFIHDHYCESPSLDEVASSVGISLFHFHRLFSQHVGITPKQYILQKQIQVARWILRSRRTPVSEVAQATGFASHGHFTSTFSRMVGVNPTAYRERVGVE